MIEIKKDIDLIYEVLEYDVIVIATSTKNSLSNGFQYKVAKSFPWVDKANRETRYDYKGKLGTCNVITHGDSYPTFILCYIHTGRYRPDIKPDVVDYESLANCLSLINNNFKDKKIACTILGHSEFEGGGDRDKCLSLIKDKLSECNVTVYDYLQTNALLDEQREYRQINAEYKAKIIDRKEYEDRHKKLLWEFTHGYYEPIPEDMTFTQLINFVKSEKKK